MSQDVLTRVVVAANCNSRENQLEVDKRQCHISLFYMRLIIQLGVFALRVCSTRADIVNNFDEIRIARRTCMDCKARQKQELTLYRVDSHSDVIDL